MGVLTDARLRELGPTLLYPYDQDMVQPASIDVHLDCYFRSARNNSAAYQLDPSLNNDDCFQDVYEVPASAPFYLGPNDFVLASTYERVIMPNNLLARLEGKSSLGRLGLLTHITAGFIDPGFVGHITLELKNVTNFGLYLCSWILRSNSRMAILSTGLTIRVSVVRRSVVHTRASSSRTCIRP
jgi:dCTP deaminase